MPLEQLLAALEREARDESARIRAEGLTESERITRAAEAALGEQRERALQARERALRPAAQERLAAVRQDGRREILAARQELLDRVAAAVRERLPQAESEPRALAARVRHGLACIGDLPADVRCATALLPQVRKLVGSRARTTVTADDAGSPLLFRAADGALEVDAGLAALLSRYWAQLAIELLCEPEAS